VLARIGPVSLTALLATLVLLFGFQGEQILTSRRSSPCWPCRS
jgi:ACR3 family arsenite transporter